MGGRGESGWGSRFFLLGFGGVSVAVNEEVKVL